MSRKIKIALLNSTDENSRWIINRYLDQFKANKNLTDSDIKRLVEIKEYNNFNKKICESRCKLNYEEGKNKGYIKGMIVGALCADAGFIVGTLIKAYRNK